MQKRVVRVISIEGNPDFVDGLLANRLPSVGHTQFFGNKATMKVLQEVELLDGERLYVTKGPDHGETT